MIAGMQLIRPLSWSRAASEPLAGAWRRWALPWARRGAITSAPKAVTAVSLGERCLMARVAPDADGRLGLVAAAEGSAAQLRTWRQRGWFDDSQVVLVLRHHERHLLTLDRPAVSDAELALAVRWPLGEALEAEPDALLTTALPLPSINSNSRAQVLAVAARMNVAQGHLAALAEAGVQARSIDVMDTALRGMALLQTAPGQAADVPEPAQHREGDGWVVTALTGGDMSIGLIWHGEFCAIRTLPSPTRSALDSVALEEQLALQIQRTTDLFERQSTALSIRHVLAALPSLTPDARRRVQAALPLRAELFSLDRLLPMAPDAAALCENNDDLTALACVAAARWLEQAYPRAAVPAPGAAEGDSNGEGQGGRQAPAAIDEGLSLQPQPRPQERPGWEMPA
jgi:hypothetical protein